MFGQIGGVVLNLVVLAYKKEHGLAQTQPQPMEELTVWTTQMIYFSIYRAVWKIKKVLS